VGQPPALKAAKIGIGNHRDFGYVNLKASSNLQLEIDRLRRKSEAAWGRFDYEQSAELLRRAQKLSPQDPRLLLDLGFQSGLRYDYAMAADYFEKAIRLAGWQTAAFAAAGLHCLNFSQPRMARGYFERALKKNPDAVDILVPLAGICERLGQLDEAETFATRATRLASGNKVARRIQAQVLRRRNRLAEAETILRTVAGQPDADVWAGAQIWYELGFNLDAQARYDEAMAAFCEAKKILRPVTEKEYVRHQTRQRQVSVDAAAVTGEMLQRFRAEGGNLEPSCRIAFLSGHPRSGTTLLEQVLDAHPDVVSLEETDIFNADAHRPPAGGNSEPDRPAWFERLLPAQLPPARKNYFDLAEKFLGQPIGSRLVIDKNPSLMIQFPVIAKIFPEAKFIVALRDPRDVCLSCFMQALRPGPVNSAYLDLGRVVQEYSVVMGFWLALRDRMAAPWLEIRYEDTVADLESVARRTLKFLELPWDDHVLAFHHHARGKIVRSPTYADVCRPIYQTAKGRWHHYRQYLEPHLPALEPFAKAFGYE
jgi:tetratricopeptide (TPR) repeat protein